MVIPLGNQERPRITPWATYLLILLNLIGYGIELASPLSFAVAYAATPYEITNGVDIYEPFAYRVEPAEGAEGGHPDASGGVLIHQAAGPRPIRLTLITALFLHADLIHLVGNMLFLSIFGQKIEEAFGRPTFVAFYLACGVIGMLAQVLAAPESLTPTLGASGAIAGVMGAYLIRFPRDRVRVLLVNVLLLIPAYAVIGCWLAIQLAKGAFETRAHSMTGDIAYLAHIGGAAAGIVLASLIWTLAPRGRRGPITPDEGDSGFLRPPPLDDDPIPTERP